MPVVGFLNIGSAKAFASFVAAFHKGLNAGGYVEGRNVTIDYRWADGDFNQLRTHAVDLAQRQVKVIAASGGLVSARAATDATRTISVSLPAQIRSARASWRASIGRAAMP